MIRLSREVRFSLVPNAELAIVQSEAGRRAKNSWAGWPLSLTVAPNLRLRCEVEGRADPVTGYLCDIQVIDRLLRDIVLEELIPNQKSTQTYTMLISEVFASATQRWTHAASIKSITLEITPQFSVQIYSRNPNMVIVTQQFEFSAAHRLHSDDLSDDENEQTYGKCNNPNGHGHNYVFEVSVAAKPDHEDVDLLDVQAKVNSIVVDRLDHKHLNRDVDYFRTIMPSVENIAKAIWKWLDGSFQTAELQAVKVYETPKTWAQYSG